MESKEIIENNILLAEFMGLVKDDPMIIGGKALEFKKGSYVSLEVAGSGFLKYHESWGCLMLVVEAIEDIKKDRHLLFQVVINGFDCYIEAHAMVHNFKSDFHHCERTKIEAVYYTCVAFIEWYNKQDKQPWKEKK